jgi:nucleotide-binding universal stress UspA family protein
MDENLIALFVGNHETVSILKDRLEAAGITCFLEAVNEGAACTGEVKLLIHASDAEKANPIFTVWNRKLDETGLLAPKTLPRILVPVDFSESSENACIYAINLAGRMQAEIMILHVYYAPIVDLVPITDAYSIQVDLDLSLRQLENVANSNLLNFVARICNKAKEKGFGHVKIRYSLREGIADDQIAQVANSFKPGIIVIGAPESGEKGNVMANRMVIRLFDKTCAPVLTIPKEAKYNSSVGVKNIVYATEFDDSDLVAIRRLMSIVGSFKVRIFCVNLAEHTRKNLDSGKMDEVINYFKKVNESIEVECLIFEGGNLASQLLDLVSNLKIDLIALTKRKRNILTRILNPGITNKLIGQGSIPLLVFRG